MQSIVFHPTIPSGLPLFYQTAILLVLAALAGVVVYFGSRLYYRGLPVSRQFEDALMPTTIIAAVILFQSESWPAVTVLALVIIGIAHFRKALEGLGDILFVFWAVLSGVLCGVGYPIQTLAIDLLLLLVIVLVIRYRMARIHYVLMIRYDLSAADQVDRILKPFAGIVVARKDHDGLVDLSIRIRLRDVNLKTIERISDIDGVHRAVVVSSENEPEQTL